MPLSSPVPRRPVHRRRVDTQAFQRDDGCWDVEIVTPDGATYNSGEFEQLRERVSGRPALTAAVDAQHLS